MEALSPTTRDQRMETEMEEHRVSTLRGRAVADLRPWMVRMLRAILSTAKPIVSSTKLV